jgi:leader peptidase (prepilin peptidase) / N-methyltransferase
VAVTVVLMPIAGALIGLGIDAAARHYTRRQADTARAAKRRRWPALLTALGGAGVGLSAAFAAPPGTALLTATFGWLLLALACIDLRTYLLPDALNAAVFALGAAMVAVTRPADWPWHAAGAALGFGILWLVSRTYVALRGEEGLGRGDAKLLGAIGVWVGALALPGVLLVASLSGIAAALVLSRLRAESLSGRSAIAFGPWLALGGYVVWLTPFLRPSIL